MKKIISVVISLLILLGIGGAAVASDISNALYYGIIRATNSGTLADDVAVNVSINTPSWITNGFVNSSVNNTAVRVGSTDIAFQPGYNTNPWIVYFDSISANTSEDVRLYTNTTGGKMRYFPDTSGMSVIDHASMEPGSTFSVNASGYFQAGTITASMSPASTQLTVTGAGDATALTPSTGSNYQCVDETYGSPNDTDYVYTTNDTVLIDYYEIQDGSIPAGAAIDSVTVYFRTKWTDEANYSRPYLRLSGTNTAGTEITNTSSFVTYSESLSRPGGGTWQVSDIADLQVGIGLRAPNGMAWCSQVSVVVAYHIEAEASITAGEHDLIVASDGTDLTITIDESEGDSAATGGSSITNNANAWYFAKAGYVCDKSAAFSITGTMLYVESISVDVSGSPAAAWVWQYGAAFEDSINSNDATPTFRTTSSDADVTAELISFQPISNAAVDSETASTWPTVMEDAPELPDTTFTEEERPGIFFEPLIHSLATTVNLPDSLFWYNFAFIIIIGSGIIVYYILAHRKEASAGGSGILFVKILTQAIFMCFFALPGLNIYGFFVPLYYLFFSSGILVLSRDYGW